MSERDPLPETEQRQPKKSPDNEVSFTSFVLRVPLGDPFLARLIEVHGQVTIERTIRIATARKTQPGAPARLAVGRQLAQSSAGSCGARSIFKTGRILRARAQFLAAPARWGSRSRVVASMYVCLDDCPALTLSRGKTRQPSASGWERHPPKAKGAIRRGLAHPTFLAFSLFSGSIFPLSRSSSR
jgi:hypothetical protein